MVNILNDNSLVNILNEKAENQTETIRVGVDNFMEISVDILDGEIKLVDCISSEIEEKSIHLPDIEKLKRRSNAIYFPKGREEDYSNIDDFKFYYSENEINIILDEKAEIDSCYVKDRVTYYYEDNFFLASIKISNLTANEYNKLKSLDKGKNIEIHTR